MSDAPFFLMHSRPDPRRLASWAARHRLVDARGDLGYAVHALLRAVFGEDAPQPYRYLDADQGLLAYTRLDHESMRQRVATADAEVVEALGLPSTSEYRGYSLRPYPMNWPAGHRLRFEVRVRPVIREGKTGRERDAFLAVVEKADGETLDRGTVYAQWLRDQLSQRRDGGAEPWTGAVDLEEVRVERFRLLEVLRRTQSAEAGESRQRRTVTGPDAVLAGHLRIVDPQAFAQLLARGVGRHRAFGFGMLLLRPAG